MAGNSSENKIDLNPFDDGKIGGSSKSQESAEVKVGETTIDVTNKSTAAIENDLTILDDGKQSVKAEAEISTEMGIGDDVTIEVSQGSKFSSETDLNPFNDGEVGIEAEANLYTREGSISALNSEATLKTDLINISGKSAVENEQVNAFLEGEGAAIEGQFSTPLIDGSLEASALTGFAGIQQENGKIKIGAEANAGSIEGKIGNDGNELEFGASLGLGGSVEVRTGNGILGISSPVGSVEIRDGADSDKDGYGEYGSKVGVGILKSEISFGFKVEDRYGLIKGFLESPIGSITPFGRIHMLKNLIDRVVEQSKTTEQRINELKESKSFNRVNEACEKLKSSLG